MGDKALLLDASATILVIAKNYFLMITKLINTASDVPGPKLTAGDFSALGICWSALSTPNYLLHFLEVIHHGGRIPDVSNPTRNRNVIELIFAIGLTNFQTST